MRGLEYPEESVKSGTVFQAGTRWGAAPLQLLPSPAGSQQWHFHTWLMPGLREWWSHTAMPKGKADLTAWFHKNSSKLSSPSPVGETSGVSKKWIQPVLRDKWFLKGFCCLALKLRIMSHLPGDTMQCIFNQAPCLASHLHWDSKTTLTNSPLQSWKGTGATTSPLLC